MKTVVITGANRGIGLELCREFQQRQWQVYAVCRRASPDLESLGIKTIAPIDVSSDEDMRKLAETLEHVKIDALINNAGILATDTFGNLDFNTLKEQFDVNTLGPLRVTQSLLPCLSDQAKVVMITSRMGSITDNSSGAYYGYRMSKAALNMAAVTLGHDLKKKGIAVALLHPGFVRTDMTNNQGTISPQDSAKRLMKRIDELKAGQEVVFKHADGQSLPW